MFLICKAVFDLPHLQEESQQLSDQASDPSFWSDPIRAKEINKKLSQDNDILSKMDDFKKRLSSCQEEIEFLKLEKDEGIQLDLESSLKSLDKDFSEFQKSIYFCGPYDNNAAILEFHPGAGGTEAHDWVSMLFRMYQRYCEAKGFSYKILDILEGEEAGISSATMLVTGKMAYGNLRSESGVHRLVRISPFDASGSRHTSFASVSVIPEFDDSINIEINPDDLQIDTYHSSGAGGQNVNKTESAVRITHKPTGIVVSCQIERSQIQNKAYAMNMLRSKLFQLEEKKRQEEMSKITGVKKDISFSSQIRSYVFCPYTLVKDHRTDYSETDVQSIMDGNIQNFIDSYLKYYFMLEKRLKENG